MKKDDEKKYWKIKSKLKYSYNEFFSDTQKRYPTKLFLKYLKNKKGTLLEAGSGWGYYLKFYSNYNKKVIGIDFEEKMIKSSKEICKSVKNIQILKADVRKIPFKDNYFDSIVSYGVVEHFNETQKAIDEMYRVLKKDGLLFISVPSAYDLTGRFLRQIAILRKKIPYYEQKHYTINSFKKHLKNFKIIYISGYGYGCGFIPNKYFKISNIIFKNLLEFLQKKESKITPLFSHMLIFVCKK